MTLIKLGNERLIKINLFFLRRQRVDRTWAKIKKRCRAMFCLLDALIYLWVCKEGFCWVESKLYCISVNNSFSLFQLKSMQKVTTKKVVHGKKKSQKCKNNLVKLLYSAQKLVLRASTLILFLFWFQILCKC